MSSRPSSFRGLPSGPSGPLLPVLVSPREGWDPGERSAAGHPLIDRDVDSRCAHPSTPTVVDRAVVSTGPATTNDHRADSAAAGVPAADVGHRVPAHRE